MTSLQRATPLIPKPYRYPCSLFCAVIYFDRIFHWIYTLLSVIYATNNKAILTIHCRSFGVHCSHIVHAHCAHICLLFFSLSFFFLVLLNWFGESVPPKKRTFSFSIKAEWILLAHTFEGGLISNYDRLNASTEPVLIYLSWINPIMSSVRLTDSTYIH